MPMPWPNRPLAAGMPLQLADDEQVDDGDDSDGSRGPPQFTCAWFHGDSGLLPTNSARIAANGASRRQQPLTDRRDVGLLADQSLQRPRRDLIAHHHRAQQRVWPHQEPQAAHLVFVLSHESVVQLPPRLAVSAADAHHVGVGPPANRADDGGRDACQPGDVQRHRFHVRRSATGHVLAGRRALAARHVPKGVQQRSAGVWVIDLRRVTGGVNVRHAGQEILVNQDPALNPQASRAGQFHRGVTPIASATRSHGMRRPSVVTMPATCPRLPTISATSVRLWICTPSAASRAKTMPDSAASSTLPQ